jgi:hypothetical protein
VARDLTARPSTGQPDARSSWATALLPGQRQRRLLVLLHCRRRPPAARTANGYIQWITADDDNGNLNDGTPHMTAIFNAFNRHGIACATPTARTAAARRSDARAQPHRDAGNFSVALSWGSIGGATRYWVFRTRATRAATSARRSSPR